MAQRVCSGHRDRLHERYADLAIARCVTPEPLEVRFERALVKAEMSARGTIAMHRTRTRVVPELPCHPRIDRIGVLTRSGRLKLMGSCVIPVDQPPQALQQAA